MTRIDEVPAAPRPNAEEGDSVDEKGGSTRKPGDSPTPGDPNVEKADSVDQRATRRVGKGRQLGSYFRVAFARMVDSGPFTSDAWRRLPSRSKIT